MGYRYIYRDKSRWGQVRLYFWRGKGCSKVRIREDFGSTAFHARYAELLKAAAPREAMTFRQLVASYVGSAIFKATGAPRTQYVTRTVLETCSQENEELGLSQLNLSALEKMRDAKVVEGKPEAANQRVLVLRRLGKWARKEGHLAHNPALELEFIRNPSDGWHTWTSEELEKFEQRWPIGTTARLCLDMAQYLGLSRADIVRAGQANLITVDGVVCFRYNRFKTGVEGNVALPEAFARTLAATNNKGVEVWLLNAYGRPYTFNGIGNRAKEWCRAAGLPDHCTLHGIRKAAAVRAAENGASANQLMALFAWLNLAHAEIYTRQANRRKLGLSGAKLLKKG
jgi:integrase